MGQSLKESTQKSVELAIVEVERVISDCGVMAIEKLSPMQKAIKLARGIQDLQKALTKDIVDELFMPLQGNALGFRTDRDKDGGYEWQTVRDCAIDALLRGYYLTGNELNIIAYRPYYTREAGERRVREFAGLTDLEHKPGGVAFAPDGKTARVAYKVTWNLNGSPMQIVREKKSETEDGRIEVRVNSGQGADAVLGKAKRKLLFQILERLTGSQILGTDGDIGDVITVQPDSVTVTDVPKGPNGETAAPVPPEQDGKRVKMPGKNGAKADPPTASAGATGSTGSTGSAPAAPTHKPEEGEVAPEHEPKN